MTNPNTLATSITAVAVAISESLPSDKTEMLGTILTQLGDTLTTIAAQRDAIKSQKQ